MKSDDGFEPIYLRDAKRHIDWLYEKIKTTQESSDKKIQTKKSPLFVRFINLLKRVF